MGLFTAFLLRSGHNVCMLLSVVVVVIMMICLYVVVSLGSCLQSGFLLPITSPTLP